VSSDPYPESRERVYRGSAKAMSSACGSHALIARAFDGRSEGLTRDDILDNITYTWLTNTALSGARLYWEYWGKGISTSKASPSRLP